LSPAASDGELLTAVRLTHQIVQLRRRLIAQQVQVATLANWAFTDPLTGLANRRAWIDKLPELFARTGSQGIVLFDLDDFKRVNDLHGHAVGDQVLRATAEAMRNQVRQHDLLARLGGDEFGLLIANIDQTAVTDITERIRRAVVEGLTRHHLPAAALSAGYVVTSANRACNPDLVYAEASRRLRTAKQRKRRPQTSGASLPAKPGPNRLADIKSLLPR
jgi:diguanylate cyclase (GGDEF)-like protein